MSFTDLSETAKKWEMFERFDSAARGLEKVFRGTSITGHEQMNFIYLGNLIGEIDQRRGYNLEEKHPELEEEATKIAPKVYQAILDNRIQADGLFEPLYRTLKSGCSDLEIKTHQIIAARTIFESVAKYLNEEIKATEARNKDPLEL